MICGSRDDGGGYLMDATMGHVVRRPAPIPTLSSRPCCTTTAVNADDEQDVAERADAVPGVPGERWADSDLYGL